MTEMKNINENQVCNECGRHCPLTALRCDRGRRVAGLLDEKAKVGESEEHSEHRSHEERREYGSHEERRGHESDKRRGSHEEERRNRNCEGRGRGHHFDRRFNLEAKGDAGLYVRLCQCGHYLSHSGREKSAQKNVLAILAEHKEGITQRELTEILGIHRASVSELLGKLEKKGFVCRIPDEQDRRQVKVLLTENGEKELPEESAKNSGSKELFSVLSEEEKTTLFNILDKLIQAWGCNRTEK